MADCFIGEVRITAANFTPYLWSSCQGQVVPISQNQALFAIIGTLYGGDGRVSFGLPNLMGRTVFSAGASPGLTQRFLAQNYGTPFVALSESELPSHEHSVAARVGNFGEQTSIAENSFISTAFDGTGASTPSYLRNPPGEGQTMFDNDAVGNCSSQPYAAEHENRQPFLALRFMIAMDGYFPPRS
ncbi:phage tail protein [Shewanella sedimentimangrovi]|uniref:Tail fiber protein n=1 Tax=Shewanella sedimentimangrovi TaxID=2814293 RepID=A0ABX7R3L1_9GAMM|nr:tail fiber protein [Shewanella sedimentimangrovi]QSX37418.1 tail fiber protein [Shewanella sedimentimangrovi]